MAKTVDNLYAENNIKHMPEFSIGQTVWDTRFEYSGVITAVDLTYNGTAL